MYPVNMILCQVQKLPDIKGWPKKEWISLSLVEDNGLLEKDWKAIKNNQKYPFDRYHA